MEPLNFELSKKQQTAYAVLTDDKTSELVFGGGARGGKTFLGSFWIIAAATRLYPGSAWLIARQSLKALKRTTMRTFFAVLAMLDLKPGRDYHYNAQDMVLTFSNGSVVFFAELKRIPTDPEFDRIGSYDLTGAWIDEAQEICADAKDALQFRLTVLSGYGWTTVPHTLYTCNPKRNWIYTDFYKPIIQQKKKIKGSAFIVSLYTDNPKIDQKKFRENALRTKNKIKIARLLKGDFEYEDDPACLYCIDVIDDLFTNVGVGDKRYIISDCARKGRDKFLIQYWEGLQCKETIDLPYAIKSDSAKAAKYIINYAAKKQVQRSHILLDSDGLGGAIVDIIKCKGFINNGSPIKTKSQIRKEKDNNYTVNYANLKAQCAFKLAELMDDGKIGVENISVKLKELLIEELQVIKQKDIDNDNKTQLISKKDMKEACGHSPDMFDTLMMRMFFELKSAPTFVCQSV